MEEYRAEYYCYIRCSTIQQSYNRQYKQLLDFCHKENIKINPANIYSEKRTGKNQDRPKFKELVQLLLDREAKGIHCCLLLIELSRLSRSYQITKDTWNTLTSAGVDIVVTSFPLLDTRKKDNGVVNLMLTDIVFAVLNYLTEQELNEKADRCNNGREVAKSKGVKFGRKELTIKDLPKEFLDVMKTAKDSDTKTALLDSINGKLMRMNKKPLSRGTFYNYLELYKGGAK
jgi:DNA invertase Pin-like site-specific DNA recombinase